MDTVKQTYRAYSPHMQTFQMKSIAAISSGVNKGGPITMVIVLAFTYVSHDHKVLDAAVHYKGVFCTYFKGKIKEATRWHLCKKSKSSTRSSQCTSIYI